MPQLDRVSLWVVDAGKLAHLAVPLGVRLNLDARRFQIDLESGQIADPEIQHPLLFCTPEIIGIGGKWREHGGPLCLMPRCALRPRHHIDPKMITIPPAKAFRIAGAEKHTSKTGYIGHVLSFRMSLRKHATPGAYRNFPVHVPLSFSAMPYLKGVQADVITLRRAGAEDIADIGDLLAQSYPRLLKADYPPSICVTAIPLIARANPRLITSGRYYVAVTEHAEIVGAGGWSRVGRAGAVGEVRHLVTDHRHLRQGIAARIVETVFTEARREGVTRLECLSTRTAQKFYTAMGFETLGAVSVGLRPGIAFPAIRMQRPL